MRLLAIAAGLGMLAGCAGAPVGFGGTDEVLFSTADTIKIQWDSLTTTEAAVAAKASAHCGGRPIQVIDAGSSAITAGLIKYKTWRCAPAAPGPTAAPAAAQPTAPGSPAIPGCGWVGQQWKCS